MREEEAAGLADDGVRRCGEDDGERLDLPQFLIVIYAWERGDHLLTERYELLYAAALGAGPDQLTDGPAALDAGHDLAQLPLPSLNLGRADGIAGAEEEDVDRREFGLAAMGLLAGTLPAACRNPGDRDRCAYTRAARQRHRHMDP